MDSDKVANFILKLRKDNNLTQKEFAEMFGVTYQAVSKWENGKNIPDVIILKDICKKFNLDINEILDGDYRKKRINKYLLISLLGALIIIIITLLIVPRDSKDFEFKSVSSSCANFNISGSIAYNKSKSHIYISDIEYCGGDDEKEYEKIECVLYESHDGVDTKIDSYSAKAKSNLEDFLQDLTFRVDDHSYTCKSFDDASVFLQINAIDKDNNVISYKIPLKLDKTCNLE